MLNSEWSGGSRLFNAVILLAAVLLSSWAAVSMNQTITWDLKNYHLYSGYAFLKKPVNYDFAPAQVQSFFNPLLHVPTYLAIQFLPAWLSIAVLGAVQGLNFFLLFRICQSLFLFIKEPWRTLLSLCSAVAGFYGAANLGELGTTFADNMVSILVLSGILLILRYLLHDRSARPPSRITLVMAGLLIGMAFGLKLNIAPYAFAACAALFAATAIRREGIRPVLIFSGCVALAFLCVYGYWGTVLYSEYGNPLFPFFNELFKSPYYDFNSASDPRFLPRDTLQTLFYPFFLAHRNNLACEVIFRDARFAICYAAIVLLAVFSISRLTKRVSRFRIHQRETGNWERETDAGACLLFLTVFFVLSYIAWQQLFSIYRYVIPLESLAPTLLTLILAYILRNSLIVAVSSLLLDLFIVFSVVPIQLGERAIRVDSLKFKPPAIAGLEKSVVLMSGFEPTSYIALGFPETTRFVRVSSNFMHPGQNTYVDERIRQTLAAYEKSRILAYFPSRAEIGNEQPALAFYGLQANAQSCIELRSSSQAHGVLCETLADNKSDKRAETPAFQQSPVPEFVSSASVRLLVTPKIVIAGKDRIHFQFVGMNTTAIDMLYTVNGRQMPPITNWRLDSKKRTEVFVGSGSEKGIYHIIGIREAGATGPWIRTDAGAEIR